MKPKLRFKGYNEEWKEIELGVITTSFSGGTPNVSNRTYYGGEIPFIRSGEIHSNKTELFLTLDGLRNSSAKLVEKGDILYALYGATSGEVDISQINGAINQAILAIKTLQGYSNLFLNYWLNTKKKYIIETYLQGGQGNLSGNIVKRLKVGLGSLLEQREIGEYFRKLDGLINEAGKEIEKLENVKKASLQKMFPQAGELVPQIRFKGFTEPWKKLKAKDIFKQNNIRNRPDLPVLSAFQDLRGLSPRAESGYKIAHDTSNEVYYKYVKPGDFAIHLRSFQGGFAHSKFYGIASPAYTIFEIENKNLHYDIYWKYIFMSSQFIKSLKLITYGIRDGRSISFNEFSEFEFWLPTYEEQKQISDYLVNLDKLITGKRKKLEKLKQIKTSCLNLMFV